MVEEFKKILNTLKEQDRPVWLFASLKMDEFIDGWSLVFSAPWIDQIDRDLELKNTLEIVKNNIPDEKLSSISRIVFMSKEDHLVEELLKKSSGEEIKGEKVNGNIIHEGYIIEANPDLVWERNKTLFK
ncbi:MAG: hypothetical protein PHO58_04775 [Bacilli bacterium]|nr:hypothetical protein [Bacilli bacterium]